MADTVLLTRKIQLRIDTTDPEVRQQVMDLLYKWQYLYFRAANHILTHLFVLVGLKQLFYLEVGVHVKLACAAKDADGILTTSKENTTHQLLSRTYKGEIPIDFLTELNHRLVAAFNKDRDAYIKGEKQLPNPKRDMPIFFKARAMRRIAPAADGRNYSFVLFKVPFATRLGRDYTDKKKLLDAWAAGTLPLRCCSLQLKKGKFFLNAVFAQPVKADPGARGVAEVKLSLEYPLTVTIGKLHYTIGSREEFLHRRLAIQAARRRVQASVTGARSDKGRKRKVKAFRTYSRTEQNFVHYQLHVYSRRLIDLCVRKQVGTILLVNQQAKEAEAKEDAFLLQNWSYCELKQKIAYKAAKVGILVIVE